MKICKNCNISFIPKACETCCSIKCRLLFGIKKQDGCWIWQGSKSSSFYGKVRINGKTFSTHRASYFVFNGDIPEGLWVCHKCDTPLCINPEHLFLGTASENRRDAMSKNRLKSIIGENNNQARFTKLQIDEMRALRSDGFTYERLSRIFNCSYTHLYRIFNKDIRKDL